MLRPQVEEETRTPEELLQRLSRRGWDGSKGCARRSASCIDDDFAAAAPVEGLVGRKRTEPADEARPMEEVLVRRR